MNNKTSHEITVIRVHHKTAASCIIRSLLCGPNEYRGYQRQECHLGAIYHKGRINDTVLASDAVCSDYGLVQINL